MAHSIGFDVAKEAFSYSDAQNAFRPWWDRVEDYLVYALILLGNCFGQIDYKILMHLKLCSCVRNT